MDPEVGQRGADTDAGEFGSDDGESVLLSDAVVQALESAERDAFGRESPVSAASDAYDEMFTDSFSDEWMHAWARLEAPCETPTCTPTLDSEPPSSLPPSSSIAPSCESQPPLPSCDSGPTEFDDMFLDDYTDQWLRACSVLEALGAAKGSSVVSRQGSGIESQEDVLSEGHPEISTTLPLQLETADHCSRLDDHSSNPLPSSPAQAPEDQKTTADGSPPAMPLARDLAEYDTVHANRQTPIDIPKVPIDMDDVERVELRLAGCESCPPDSVGSTGGQVDPALSGQEISENQLPDNLTSLANFPQSENISSEIVAAPEPVFSIDWMQDIPRPHSPDSPYLIHRRYRNYRSYIRDRQKTSVPAQTTQTTPSVPAPKIPPHDIEICAFFGMFPKCRFIPGKPYTQMVEELILAYRMNAQDARHAREQLQGILNRRSMALTSARNVHSRRSSSSDWLTKPALHVAEDDERQYTRAILAASPSKKRKTSYETDRMPKKPRLRLFAVAGPVSETHRDNQTSDPLAEFFAEYPAFKYNPRSPISAQYQAMCGMYGLRKPAKFVIESPSQRAQREKVWERYRIAMGRAFAHQFGRDAYDLRNWQGLCVVLDISPVPGTIEGCKIEIRALHVNIVDLLDTGRTGRPVRKFESEAALAKYTREHRKIFPKQEADTLLSHLLRFLAQYWPGVTRR